MYINRRHIPHSWVLVIFTLIATTVYYMHNRAFNYLEYTIKGEAQCYDVKGNIFRLPNVITDPDYKPDVIQTGKELKSVDTLFYNSYGWLQRPFQLGVQQEMMNLLEQFLEMLKSHEITFIMSHGMLLGSYFFHDIIPWDDDLDIFIDLKDIAKLRSIFRHDDFQGKFGVHSFDEEIDVNMYSEENLKLNINENNAHICGDGIGPDKKCYQSGKVYMLTSPHAGRREWRYPFVDFFFLKNNGTHYINFESTVFADPLSIKLEDFHPVVDRPFNRFWIPAPRDSRKYLKSRYNSKFGCSQSSWDHINDRNKYTHKMFAQKAPCEVLKQCYPYVKRRPALNNIQEKISGQVIEDLLIGNITLHSVIIMDDFYHSDVLSFGQNG